MAIVEQAQPAEPQAPRPSLVFQSRNNVICTACGGLGEPKDMKVWYTNSANKPWGPGKAHPEVHLIHNTERCITKANTVKGGRTR